MCQVSLELKEFQMGTLVLKLNKGPIFSKKTGNNQCFGSAAPIQAFVPESRCNCDVKLSCVNVCAKFH